MKDLNVARLSPRVTAVAIHMTAISKRPELPASGLLLSFTSPDEISLLVFILFHKHP